MGGPRNPDRPWTMRVAGASTILVGAINVLVAVVSTSVSGLTMQPLTAVALGAAGLATAWLGLRIWRGVAWALHVAAVAFTLLLGAQLVLANPDTPETGTSRLVLGMLVAVLLVAVVHLRRRADRG